MSEGQKKLLLQLIELSKIDAVLAGIGAQRKTLETSLADNLLSIEKSEGELALKSEEVKGERMRFQKEEHRLRDENEKLVERRKSLNTFSDYKVQQAAQKEIEQSSKQLSAQEEKLLASLDALEANEATVKELTESLEKQKEEFQTFEEESKGTLATLEERQGEKSETREQLASSIDDAQLKIYNRIRQRFVADPVVPLSGSACTGCNVEVGPQMVVQVSRAQSLVKCRGCGRILYLEEQAAEAGESA